MAWSACMCLNERPWRAPVNWPNAPFLTQVKGNAHFLAEMGPPRRNGIRKLERKIDGTALKAVGREAATAMMNQSNCPFCEAAAVEECAHLALAAEGRDFVRRCVEACHGQRQWELLCKLRREWNRMSGHWSPEQDDFVWLETAFANEFLKSLPWFGGLDQEWRTGPRSNKGGFWVLLWSKDPQRLWWQLRDEIDRQTVQYAMPSNPPPAIRSSPPLFP
jgi:hypothetical protein